VFSILLSFIVKLFAIMKIYFVIIFAVTTLLPADAFSEASLKGGSEVYDEWTYKCTSIDDDASNQICEISQIVLVEDEDRAVEVLRLAVSRGPDAKRRGYQLVALTSLGVHLPSDFGLMAGKARLSLSRYRNCNQRGCFAIVPLSDDAIKRLKRANEGAAYFRDLAGTAIKVTFPLQGFTKAFDRLSAGSAGR